MEEKDVEQDSALHNFHQDVQMRPEALLLILSDKVHLSVHVPPEQLIPTLLLLHLQLLQPFPS